MEVGNKFIRAQLEAEDLQETLMLWLSSDRSYSSSQAESAGHPSLILRND